MNIKQARQPQLELVLPSQPQPRRRRQISVRRQRATWWFREMHRVVDEAIDWAGQPTGPRQQTLTVSVRQ